MQRSTPAPESTWPRPNRYSVERRHGNDRLDAALHADEFTRMTSRGAHFGAVLGSAAVLLLSACTAPASRVTPAEHAPELSTLRRADVSWLERVTFGLDSQAVGDYRRLGR